MLLIWILGYLCLSLIGDIHEVQIFMMGYDVEGQSVNDPIWGGEAIYAAYDVKGSSHWAELLAGVDAKIVGPFRLGWSFRYRSRISQKHGDIGEAWYVPGYGKKGSSRLGATFNLILEI